MHMRRQLVSLSDTVDPIGADAICHTLGGSMKGVDP
jgi:hypothetical protein